MSAVLEIQMIIVLISVACAVLGVFLVLRQMAMQTDAISHTVLLGIVVTYLFVGDLNSPILIIGAGIVGVLTVFCTETFMKVAKINEDSAIGLVFSTFFSLAIIIITKFTSDIHLDIDTVILGEIVYAPFNRLIINDVDVGAKGVYVGIVLVLINIIYMFFYAKKLEITTFDALFAKSLGIASVWVNYSFMTIASITIVGAFDVVGSILVIAFMIIPANIAYLLTNNIRKMFVLSLLFAIIGSLVGVNIAILLDVSIAGMIATVFGIIFMITLLDKRKKY